MYLSWSSNTITFLPDVEMFLCFLRRPNQVPGPAAPLERAAIPVDMGTYIVGDAHNKLLFSGAEGQSKSFSWEGGSILFSMEEE